MPELLLRSILRRTPIRTAHSGGGADPGAGAAAAVDPPPDTDQDGPQRRRSKKAPIKLTGDYHVKLHRDFVRTYDECQQIIADFCLVVN